MFKRVLLLVCSLSCAAITAGSVAVVGEFDEEARRNPAFVAFYSMQIYGFATATFAAANFALPTYRLLPERSYTVSNQRVVSLIYHALGVWLFRKILLVAFWNRAGNRTSFFNGKKSGIDRMIKNQKQSEFGHLGSMLVLLGASGYFIGTGEVRLFLGTSIVNFFGNLYPIILQRYNGARVRRLIEARSC